MNTSRAVERNDYYARRERQERAVAERAASDIARRIHLDLAERYAALVRA
jgi:hypothetical protein